MRFPPLPSCQTKHLPRHKTAYSADWQSQCENLLSGAGAHDYDADLRFLAEPAEVLDRVHAALTQAAPAEIQGLFEANHLRGLQQQLKGQSSDGPAEPKPPSAPQPGVGSL